MEQIKQNPYQAKREIEEKKGKGNSRNGSSMSTRVANQGWHFNRESTMEESKLDLELGIWEFGIRDFKV